MTNIINSNILASLFPNGFTMPELTKVYEYPEFHVLKNIVVSFPDTTDEQLIIAQFFSRLDALIAAEDKKLEKLKNLKNASLEKMFPSKGKAIPQIRFKGFVGEWRKGELSEVAGYYRVSNETVHHQNLLSLSYGKIVKKNIKSKKGLLPASFDTYQVIKENIIVLRFTDLQNDHKSLRVGLSKEEGIKLVNEKKSDKDIYEYLVTKGLTDSYEEYISESQIIAKEKFSKMEKQDILKELADISVEFVICINISEITSCLLAQAETLDT